jgi:acyl carrier protein
MTEQEILAGLGEIVEEIAGVPADEVTPSKSFVDDLDIDSLSMVEIAVAAQDKFGVEIPDDRLKDLTTVTPDPGRSWPRSSPRPGRW